MEISLPSDCGNAPRMLIVSEFISNWAKGDSSAVAEWLSDDANWVVIGEGSHTGPDSATRTVPHIIPERVEVLSIVTHGRHASCDGYLEVGTNRVHFSHMFRFKSAAKTAKIAEIRTYSIKTH